MFQTSIESLDSLTVGDTAQQTVPQVGTLPHCVMV